MHFTAIRDLVKTDLAAVDDLIIQCLQNSAVPLIHQVAQHLLQSGGKRIRPLLVLLSAETCGYHGSHAIQLAAILELIHTATLLHDDVIDTSTLRRGQKTANALWGNPASVLVGDFLYSRAFQMMVAMQNLAVIAELAEATNTIVEGEILQLLNCGDPATTEARYMQVIRYKTGKLFAVAAKLGAVLAQRNEQEQAQLAEYGLRLGTAFQLVDDALDYVSSAETIGKHIGDDLTEGKPTLPLLYALQHGNPTEQQIITAAIKHKDHSQIKVILETIASTGAIAYTYQTARNEVAVALNCLNGLPHSRYYDALCALAEFAIARTY